MRLEMIKVGRIVNFGSAAMLNSTLKKVKEMGYDGVEFAGLFDKSAEEVKALCEKYGLTQTALAKRFDIPLRTVQDWHGGRRNPPDYVVTMMVELLEKEGKA